MQYENQLSGTTHKMFYDKTGPHRAITSTELASVCIGNSFTLLLYHVTRKSSNNSNGSKARGFTLWPTFSNHSLCSLGMILQRLLKFLIMSCVFYGHFFWKGVMLLFKIRNILHSYFYLLCIFPLVMHHAMLQR